jgi:hypothetical protein
LFGSVSAVPFFFVGDRTSKYPPGAKGAGQTTLMDVAEGAGLACTAHTPVAIPMAGGMVAESSGAPNRLTPLIVKVAVAPATLFTITSAITGLWSSA